MANTMKPLSSEEVVKLQKLIETAKNQKIKLETQLEQMMEKLEKEYKCESLEQAEKKVSDLEMEIEKGKKLLQSLSDSIRDKLPKNIDL
jgi:predicted  nucleic acid-binding Zn-ribbon protein